MIRSTMSLFGIFLLLAFGLMAREQIEIMATDLIVDEAKISLSLAYGHAVAGSETLAKAELAVAKSLRAGVGPGWVSAHQEMAMLAIDAEYALEAALKEADKPCHYYEGETLIVEVDCK